MVVVVVVVVDSYHRICHTFCIKRVNRALLASPSSRCSQGPVETSCRADPAIVVRCGRVLVMIDGGWWWVVVVDGASAFQHQFPHQWAQLMVPGGHLHWQLLDAWLNQTPLPKVEKLAVAIHDQPVNSIQFITIAACHDAKAWVTILTN